MGVLPVVTPEQRAEALRKASAIRTQRVQIKASIKGGGLDYFRELIRVTSNKDVDTARGKMRIIDAVKALPGYGSTKSESLLTETKIDTRRRLVSLTPGQRERLLEKIQIAS